MLLIEYTASSQCTPVNLERISLPSNEWIGNGYIKGLLRLLPADYAANPTKKYPVIIYFHGNQAAGDGSQDALCKIIGDGASALPGKIESNEFPTTVTVNGQTHSYIVLMPQYTGYSEPPYYADKIEAFIDYAMSAYRIDPTRVYLTGMSSGANHVIDYVSSSASRAQRIAAIAMSSMCWRLSLNPAGPANIANAGLPTWFVHCALDNPCVVAWPDEWVNAINNQPGAIAPRYSRLDQTPNPQPFPFPLSQQLLYCRPFPHDTWLALYSPLFTPAGGPNLYQWLLQHSRSTLPVRLKNFSARLTAGKVLLQWTTTSETENASFIIERAGSDGRFMPLATRKGSGNSGIDKQYDYSDEKPLPQLSYYRLVQADIDGDKQYLGTKTIANRQGLRQLIIPASNPFTNNIVAYINVEITQKVIVEVTDMSGRKIAGLSGIYASGATEINLPATQLPKGMYYLKARSGSTTETYKIVKQ
ncbi:T9SS type A sorting domain-containing protein [Paraflavitalea speifideaquila]|uniref:T9SS type A sorting domain-containing protein n=1 Tax=Paraflavitalea speifideaquila TaxID=3076558 RepID=UPI0028E5F23D|nr:T9SS type A sorting domain-containing protein [Paraflavitalea speifideiaquila]